MAIREKIYNLEQKFLERYNALMLDHIVSPRSRVPLITATEPGFIWFSFRSVTTPFHNRNVFKDSAIHIQVIICIETWPTFSYDPTQFGFDSIQLVQVDRCM